MNKEYKDLVDAIKEIEEVLQESEITSLESKKVIDEALESYHVETEENKKKLSELMKRVIESQDETDKIIVECKAYIEKASKLRREIEEQFDVGEHER